MLWQEWSQRLKEVLELRGSPVAVRYSIEPGLRPTEGKHWVCDVIKEARQGKSITLTKENSACPGGSAYLGFTPRPEGERLRALQRFLVGGEKLFCSPVAFHRAVASTSQPPLGVADAVVFAPLEAIEAEPDLVVFLCDPEQACRLISLATYWTGISPRTEMVGSGCHMAITYPLVSGEVNVSFMDYTARKMKGYERGELLVSVPYHRLGGVVSAIPRCSAGTAERRIPPEFARPS